MNRRILELAQQAGFDAELMQQNHDKGNPSIAEQFAELIVEECVKICEDGINHADDWDSSYWDQACESRAIAIKKYFGVK